MSYLHVLVATSERSEVAELFVDLSESELKRAFLLPYQRGKKMVAGSRILDVSSIQRIHIVKTDLPSKMVRQALNKRLLDESIRAMRDGIFGIPQTDTPDALLDEGEDVTEEFITHPPGDSGRRLGLLAIANNRLVATVVGGLILASIITYCKLKA